MLTELDGFCLDAKASYGADGAVLFTPDDSGKLLPEVAHIPQRSYDQQSAGSDQLLN